MNRGKKIPYRMIPNARSQVNKFDPKVLVLFDTRALPPYKETVIETLGRLPSFNSAVVPTLEAAARPSAPRRAPRA
jgi:hypothetical protein